MSASPLLKSYAEIPVLLFLEQNLHRVYWGKMCKFWVKLIG